MDSNYPFLKFSHNIEFHPIKNSLALPLLSLSEGRKEEGGSKEKQLTKGYHPPGGRSVVCICVYMHASVCVYLQARTCVCACVYLWVCAGVSAGAIVSAPVQLS